MSTRYYAIVFKDLTQVVLRVKFRSSFCSWLPLRQVFWMGIPAIGNRALFLGCVSPAARCSLINRESQWDTVWDTLYLFMGTMNKCNKKTPIFAGNIEVPSCILQGSNLDTGNTYFESYWLVQPHKQGVSVGHRDTLYLFMGKMNICNKTTSHICREY